MDNMGTRFDFTSKRCDLWNNLLCLLLFMDNTSAAGLAGWYTWISLGGYSPAFAPDGMPHGRFAWFRTCWDCFWKAVVKCPLSGWLRQDLYTARWHPPVPLHSVVPRSASDVGKNKRQGGMPSLLVCDGCRLTARALLRGFKHSIVVMFR